MYLQSEKIVRKVLEISDELGDFFKSDLILATDAEVTEQRIRAMIPIVGSELISAALPGELDDALPLPDRLFISPGGSGHLPLPDDFLRLRLFRMSDWERGVTEPVGEESLEYRLQTSCHEGLRASPSRPVVALAGDIFGRRLEFFGSRSDEAEMEAGLYIPHPRPGRDGRFFFPSALLGRLICGISERILKYQETE